MKTWRFSVCKYSSFRLPDEDAHVVRKVLDLQCEIVAQTSLSALREFLTRNDLPHDLRLGDIYMAEKYVRNATAA